MEVLIPLWLLSGIATAIITRVKGRRGFAGLGIGFLLGPVGTALALFMPRERKLLEKEEKNRMRPCPECAEPIRREARKCRYCHSPVPSLDTSAAAAPRLR